MGNSSNRFRRAMAIYSSIQSAIRRITPSHLERTVLVACVLIP